MAKKLIINNIESCSQCPNCDWDEIGSCSLYCSLVDIDDNTIADSSGAIPEWCPLPDEEEVKEGT